MKIRIWLKNKIRDKYFVDGEMDEKSLEELKNFGCTTLTLGKTTISVNEIIGWEIIDG